jgi:4-hydroxy-2-oxoheptanedioate aldolase
VTSYERLPVASTNALMPTHFLKEKLRSASRTALGLWCVVPDANVAEMAAISGHDFIVLDCEHGRFELSDIEAALRAAELHGVSPLVRSPGLDTGFIQRVLDLGAHGVLVPQIANAEEARLVASLTHFAPRGRRGANPFTRGGGYADPAHARTQDDWALTGVLVESPAGFAALDEIAATPGIDIVFLGAYDYSATIGKLGQMEDPALINFIEDGIRRIAAQGRLPFVLPATPQKARRAAELGARMVGTGFDSGLMRAAFAKRLNEMREALP